MNNVNGMDEVESAKHSKTSNYHAPTGYAPTSAYPSSFLSGEIDSSYTPGNTNTVNTMNNLSSTKNSKKGNYHSSTAAPRTAGYPITFQSDDIDLSSVPPGYPGHSNNTNNVNRVKSMDAAKNGKKSNYHSSTVAPPVAKYPSASQSSEVDSSYTRNNTTSGVKGMKYVNGAKNGNNSNYQGLTGTEPIPSCPRAFQPDELHSSSTPGNKNSMNNATKINAMKNSKKGNYHSPTAASATAGYPSALQSSDIDSSSTWNNANPVINTSSVNRTNNTSKGKTGTYGSATTGSDIAAYSSSVQSSDTGSSSNSIAAAWEEHIDETTNRKYFYNTITRRVSHITVYLCYRSFPLVSCFTCWEVPLSPLSIVPSTLLPRGPRPPLSSPTKKHRLYVAGLYLETRFLP